MDGVYKILNHMTGDSLFTHQLPRAGRWAGPLLLARYPQLEAAGSAKNLERLSELVNNAKARGESPMEGVKMWLGWLRESSMQILSESYEIPSYIDRWLSLNPMDELVNMVGEEKIITVKP